MTHHSLTPDTAKRLLRMMLWVEQQQEQGPSGSVGRNTEVPNVQLVRVGAEVIKASGEYLYWTSQVVQFDSEAGALEELGVVYLADLNGTPEADAVYLAIQSGEAADGTTVFTTAQPCCGEQPGNCCDLEAIDTACVTFPFAVEQVGPLFPYSASKWPGTYTVTYLSDALGMFVFFDGLDGPNPITGPWGWIFLVYVRCIQDSLYLVFQNQDGSGVPLAVPLELMSCDPFEARYTGPDFDWVCGGNSNCIFRFSANAIDPITVVGPGACP